MSVLKFIQRVCVQTAVYWKPLEADGYGGMIYADPVEVKVRWDDVSEIIKTNDGEEIVSKAKLMITQDLLYRGYLMLGKINELTINERYDPRTIMEAYEIKSTLKTPLFRSTNEFVREIYL